MKFALLFERFLMEDEEIDIQIADGFETGDNDKTGDKSLSILLSSKSFRFITVQDIIQRWDYFNKVKYDSTASMNILKTWESVLDYCKKGKELTGQQYKIFKQSVTKINCVF